MPLPATSPSTSLLANLRSELIRLAPFAQMRAEHVDRFVAGAWTELKTGAPALVDAVGVIDCHLEELIERHGAVIALGRVVAYTASSKDPLISFCGGYL